MYMRTLIAFACISMLLFIPAHGAISHSGTEKVILRAKPYNPNTPPKTFEDLFFPHWFENGTYTYDVPEYMHKYQLNYGFIWSNYYIHGAEKGRIGKVIVKDNTGIVYLNFTNEETNKKNGTPIGGPGRYPGGIKGNKFIIKVTGKIMFLFAIGGSWIENIVDGGVYNVTINGKKLGLFMDYYNPTNRHTFYFKASQPVYAYLFGWDGKLLSYTSKPVKEGYITEPYDATPFLVFERGGGEKGNITVEFWMGYPPKHTDVGGVLIMLGIIGVMVAVAYVYSKRSIYGKGGKKR